jgi:hypothetical protein
MGARSQRPNEWKDTTMTGDAQWRHVSTATRNWKPSFSTQPIGAAELRHGLANGDTRVALNGSLKKSCAYLARAADNVASWKTYLPEECVRAMMNHGWHWST